MTEPKPAPVKPKPIRDDPTLGQVQVVVSWRVPALTHATVTDYRDAIEGLLRARIDKITDLYVTAYRIITPSEMEGTVGPLANLDDVEHVRDTRDVPTEGGRL